MYSFLREIYNSIPIGIRKSRAVQRIRYIILTLANPTLQLDGRLDGQYFGWFLSKRKRKPKNKPAKIDPNPESKNVKGRNQKTPDIQTSDHAGSDAQKPNQQKEKPKKAKQKRRFGFNEIQAAQNKIEQINLRKAPLALDISDDYDPKVNILISKIDFSVFFGGYISVFNLAMGLWRNKYKVRIVIVDECDINMNVWKKEILKYKGLEKFFRLIEVAYRFDRSNPLSVSPRDRFLAISAWTAYLAHAATQELGQERFIYLTQEYEPLFHDAGSIYNLLNNSYALPHFAIYSTEFYRAFARNNHIGVFADDRGDEYSVSLQNAIPKSPVTLEKISNRKTKKLVAYARPEFHAHRNMFEFLLMGLNQAVEEGHFDDADWEFHGIGTADHAGASIPIGKDYELELLERVSLNEYLEMLPNYDVGLSLMASPHPSLPPLDMAGAGILTVTNTLFTKTANKLLDISENLIPVNPNPEAISNGLREAVSRVENYDDRIEAANINWPRTWNEALSSTVMGHIISFIGFI